MFKPCTSVSVFHRFKVMAAALACAALLQACGGGGSDAGTPATAPPTVSGVTVDYVNYGLLSTFTVTGTNLATSANFSIAGCDGLAIMAGGSNAQQTLTCTPNNTLSVRLAVGSGSGEVYGATLAVTPSPTVSGVTYDYLNYGLLSTFTVTGTNLATLANFSATGCDGLALKAGGSNAQQVLTCTPNKALNVRLLVNSANREVYNSTVAVPKPQVVFTTTKGSITIDLEPAYAPITVDNFLAYVQSGFYDGTIFHRVISGFTSQGGGYTRVANGTLTPQVGARPAIALETDKGLGNVRGTIAMARLDAANTATSEFFFNQVNNANLDYASSSSPGYAVFGSISGGLAVMDAINAVSTSYVGYYDHVPNVDVVLNTATRSK